MSTKVIDKLRIQGKSAPRVALDPSTNARPLGVIDHAQDISSPVLFGSPLLHTEPIANKGGPRANPSRPALALIPEPGQEVNSKIPRPFGSSIPSSSSSSAASRRLEFLQRVQQANRGLTTADGDIRPSNNSPLAHSREQIGDSINSVAKVNCAYTHQLNPTLPNIQFLLRGKPVQKELEIGAYKVSSAPTPSMKSEFNINANHHQGSHGVQVYVPHQRVGHYKTSAKEVYRARHKHDIVHSLLMDPRHASSAYHAVRTGYLDFPLNANIVLGNSPSVVNGPAYFYLGPPMSAPTQTKSSVSTINRPKFYIPTASAQIANSDSVENGQEGGHASMQAENFSVAGQQFTTPRWANMKTGNESDLHEYYRHLEGVVDYGEAPPRSAPFIMPDIYNRQSGSSLLVSGSKSRKHGGSISIRSRESGGAPPVPPSSSAAGVDVELLQQCLHVKQPQSHADNGSGVSSSEDVRLKHLTQFIKKDDSNSGVSNSLITTKTGKINYNNPYRNQQSHERKAAFSPFKPNRYVFNSVNSYIHFNKIYPKLDGSSNDATTNATTSSKNGNGIVTPQIPQVDGFSPHCTETVMLKMMFGMNKPTSVKSGARYSDIAVHADLDEFVVVGSTTTTSASRSTSVASRKFHQHNSSSTNQENANDNNCSNRRQSNTTMRRKKSNLSSSIDVSVDLRERKSEENEDEADEDPNRSISEIADKAQAVGASGNFFVGNGDIKQNDNDEDANMTMTALGADKTLPTRR